VEGEPGTQVPTARCYGPVHRNHVGTVRLAVSTVIQLHRLSGAMKWDEFLDRIASTILLDVSCCSGFLYVAWFVCLSFYST